MAARRTRKKTARKKAKPQKARAPRARRTHTASAGAKGGRPTIEFDDHAIETIRELSQYGNKVEHIARILKVSKATLERRIADPEHPAHEAYQTGRAERADGLWRAMWANALRGNATIQMFLAKNELGLRDFKAIEVTGPGGGPVRVADEYLDLAHEKLQELIRSRREVQRPAPRAG